MVGKKLSKGSGHRFVLVRDDLNPRLIYRGTAGEILEALEERPLSPGHSRGAQLPRISRLSSVRRFHVDDYCEEVFRQKAAREAVAGFERDGGLEIRDEDDYLRAVCVALGTTSISILSLPDGSFPTNRAG